jgi:hypothetical protein
MSCPKDTRRNPSKFPMTPYFLGVKLSRGLVLIGCWAHPNCNIVLNCVGSLRHLLRQKLQDGKWISSSEFVKRPLCNIHQNRWRITQGTQPERRMLPCSLVATTSHILALKLTASRLLMIGSLSLLFEYSLDFHKYCLRIVHSQPSVLLGLHLTSNHTVVILQPFTILLHWFPCITYFEWVPYIASVHSQAVWSWSQPCARISLLP